MTTLPPLTRRVGLPPSVANVAIIGLIAAAIGVNAVIQKLLENRGFRYPFDIAMDVGIAIILAVSLNLINGITGQFSLGHAGFMALGAYVCGVLMAHWQPQGNWTAAAMLATTLLGGIVAAAAGLVVGIPTLRFSGDYLAIATLGFGQIIGVVLNKIESIGSFTVGGSAGLHNIPILNNFFWTFSWCLICIVAVWRMVHSARGKAFFAVREDEIAAAAVGVNPTRVKVTAFVVGAFFAGVAGALSATWKGNLAPGGFGFMKSIEIVVMVVLGGSGSISGTILAAILLTWLPEELRFLQDWRLVIYSLILIVLMLLRPTGLLGSRELWWTRSRAKGVARAAA